MAFDPSILTKLAVKCTPCDTAETVEPERPLRAAVRWYGHAGQMVALTGYSAIGPEVRVPRVARIFRAPDSEQLALRMPTGVDPERGFDILRRFALPMLMQANGAEVTHASAVSGDAGVVAFCGNSGEGKSTIAHALTARGFSAVADDVVVIDPAPASPPCCIPIAFRFRLENDPRQTIRTFAPNRESPQLRALCELRRGTHARPHLTRVGETEAFSTLLRHAFMFSVNDPDLKQRSLTRYLQLCSQLPVYHLFLPSDLTRLPEALDLCGKQLLGAAVDQSILGQAHNYR